MKFIRIIALSLVVLATSFLTAPSASAQTTDRFAEFAIDFTSGTTLIGVNENEPRYPASLTKMMTLYLLFEALDEGSITLDTRWSVSRRAAGQPPTRLGFRCTRRARTCGTITVDQAIDALVVLSANDVASVVAEHLGRTESNFALRMTRRAHDMGMENTTFINASGLPNARQVTTASDMAILARRLIEDYPDYYPRFSRLSFTYAGRTYNGHNRVMRDNDEVDGIKTGYTRGSGFNLVSSAVRDGRRVITVVLGGATAGERDAQMVDLIQRAFERQLEITPREGYPYIVTHVDQRIGLPLQRDREEPWTLFPEQRQ